MRVSGRLGLAAVIGGLLIAGPALSQVLVRPSRKPEMVRPPGAPPLPAIAPSAPPGTAVIRPEPIAETKLLMEGINQPNFRGMQQLLAKEPATVEQWTFLRGQALLVAETGNLLLLRPPKNQGDESWQVLSAAQRSAATRLARAASDRDYVRSRVALAELTNACNKCHRTFRVPAQLDPLPEAK
jgi:hypothetical protein